MAIELTKIELPDFEIPVERPLIPAGEYGARMQRLYDDAGCDWVAIYGDREHFGNLLHLTGFDPRFEEALLLLGPGGIRQMLLGSEGLIYRPITSAEFEVAHYQPFSLMGQPLSSPGLSDLLREAGIGKGDRVGVISWKYLTDEEGGDGRPAWVPVHIAQTLGQLTGEELVDLTHLLLDPGTGQRITNSAAQIAQFEWGTARASAAVMRVVRNAKPGMTEMEAVAHLGYAGEPLTMHPVFGASRSDLNGLASPSHRIIEEGAAAMMGIGYWGGLCARAGLITATVDERFLQEVAIPYYRAIVAWWENVAIGVSGDQLTRIVEEKLSGSGFGSLLNPGHLTSHDEWLHSFVRRGVTTEVRSGMVFQCDIIPDKLAPGWAINCEDTLAIADETLRSELEGELPAVWRRIESRREFMQEKLGIHLHADVLPLSSAPGYLRPFWMIDAAMAVR